MVPNPSTWHFGDHIERHKVTNLWVVPPIVLVMAKQRVADRYDLSSLRRFGFGSCSIWERVDMVMTILSCFLHFPFFVFDFSYSLLYIVLHNCKA